MDVMFVAENENPGRLTYRDNFAGLSVRL